MSIWTTPERRQLRKSVRAFAEREILPHIDEWEAAGELPRARVGWLAGSVGEREGLRQRGVPGAPGPDDAADRRPVVGLRAAVVALGAERHVRRVAGEVEVVAGMVVTGGLAAVAETMHERQMVRLAATKLDAGSPEATTYCAMAKRLATDLGFRVCNEALQLHGGYGYIREYPLERYFRDVRVHQILEGTNEIMRVIISRKLLDRDNLDDIR